MIQMDSTRWQHCIEQDCPLVWNKANGIDIGLWICIYIHIYIYLMTIQHNIGPEIDVEYNFNLCTTQHGLKLVICKWLVVWWGWFSLFPPWDQKKDANNKLSVHTFIPWRGRVPSHELTSRHVSQQCKHPVLAGRVADLTTRDGRVVHYK